MVVLTLACVLLACGVREEDITLGSDKDTGGNYWGRNVSKQFQRPQLNALYKVMNGPATKDEIAELNCGKRLPQHEFSVTLWTEGEYRERLVRLQMTPRIYEGDECLQEAVNFVFQRTVKSIDPGPPIDYGYRNPQTGEHLDTSKFAESLPDKPSCPCVPSK